ncbi:hypothetical protein DL95DRAFT_522976 [Leptodontidium sp. 2 PMI_412]|nr:hypothetical protein DL95DRAFT_522976 [Leptodontidium sp. 2 PMI_412]
MPPISKTSKPASQCTHPTLCYTTTHHAQKAGYVRPTLSQRLAAATPAGTFTTPLPKYSNPDPNSYPDTDPNSSSESDTESKLYPAPLVLPGSEISLYPQARGQSLRGWLRNGNVNRVTEERKVIYISLPPGYGEGVEAMRGWTVPVGFGDANQGMGKGKGKEKGRGGNRGNGKRMGMGLDYELVARYVGVFYHGLEVKVLPEGEFAWLIDEDGNGNRDSEDPAAQEKRKGKSRAKTKGNSKARSRSRAVLDFENDPRIGLRSSSSNEYTTIRSRPTPNYPYSNQLNLNDILDFAIASLPDDAYALLMLLEHDLYEDEEDEFVCGRAYGGSRVAVVSGARYWPGFDEEENVERVHGWPASHCDGYLETVLDDDKPKSGRKKEGDVKKRVVVGVEANGGIERATPLQRTLKVYAPPKTPKALTLLHIARLARTASHELGHCVGIAHCTYYACIMQGSASLAEDARQPPYLCPVDEAKVLRATGKGVVSERRMESWRRERLVAMRQFCKNVVEEWGVDGGGSMFECLEKWVEALLEREGEGSEREEKKQERVVIDLTMDE